MMIKNPISHIERVGFLFWLIPIRYLIFYNLCARGKKAQVWKSTNFDAGLYDITEFLWALIISIYHHMKMF
jgi:hypothetical protein